MVLVNNQDWVRSCRPPCRTDTNKRAAPLKPVEERPLKKARTETPHERDRRMPALPLTLGSSGIHIDLNQQAAKEHLLLSVPGVANIARLPSSPSELESFRAQMQNRQTWNLSGLYNAFLDNVDWKTIVAEVLRTHLQPLRSHYKSVKAKLRHDFGFPEEEEGTSTGEPKGWSAKVKRLGQSDEDRATWAKGKYASATRHALGNVDVCVLDFPDNADWFTAMVAMSLLRKHLVAGNIASGKSVQHLTVLNFQQGFSLFAVNSRHAGAGTTRMVWPMTRQPDHAEEYKSSSGPIPFLRVLDLSYGELYQWTQILTDKFHWPHDELAQAMLSIIRGGGDPALVQRLRKGKTSIGYPRCSFLYGWTLKNGCLSLTKPDWYLSKKSRSAKNLSSRSVTQYEVACYILSILFLAEPRHALGMWHACERALELVAEGRLSFAHLFSSLGGSIRYGRLLPGANVLGRALTHDVKRLAMPLVDSVLRDMGTEESNLAEEYNAAKAIAAKPTLKIVASGNPFSDPSIATLPVYQPLMKVLFVELLDLLAKVFDKKWNDQVKPEETKQMEGEQAEEGLGEILHQEDWGW